MTPFKEPDLTKMIQTQRIEIGNKRVKLSSGSLGSTEKGLYQKECDRECGNPKKVYLNEFESYTMMNEYINAIRSVRMGWRRTANQLRTR